MIHLGDPVTPDNLYYRKVAIGARFPSPPARPRLLAGAPAMEKLLTSPDGNQVADFYMQFDADDQSIFEGIPTQDLIIDVEYLDVGYDTFNLQYDGMYGGPFNDGRFKGTLGITKTNTGEWMTARFVIDEAYFGNRDNDGDFRIYDCGDGYEIIRKVTVILVVR